MTAAAITAEQLRLLCEQAGLTRALELFPDGVRAAVERGLKPIGDHPGVSPIASPAPVFDPARFEQSE
ncbi:MAG: hypothetical protein ACREDY_18355 [Bradyrhizobium sp.]